MKKTVQKVPFLRLIIALTTGIAAGSLVEIPIQPLFLIMALTLATIILIHKSYRYSWSNFFGFGVHLLFVLLGMFIFQQYNKKPVFYNNGQFAATVLEMPQEKPNSFQTTVRVTDFSNDSIHSKTHEKIIVYFVKGEKAKSLKPGDRILFRQNPEWIKNNGNPYEFDYKKYLQRKKICRQLYLQPANWERSTQKPSVSLIIMAEQTREKLLTIYRRQNLGEEQFKILSALTLGYKRELNAEIKQVFSASGAMHVLAVSGLHVGIIYLALSFLFGFMKKKKAGRIFFVVFIVFILWFYAFITGLSPSVERAATMFSFVVAGNSLKRQVSIYNSLAASAFFLLLFNPNNLFEVGFQLSYSAVFGIVYLQPVLSRLLTVKSKLLNYFWMLLTVSVSAQIATVPFTLYYFSQFPTYFWISNLFVIPAVTILIPLGILLLLLSGIPLFSTLISVAINHLIFIVYFLLQQIEQLPFSVLHQSVHPVEFAGLLFILGSVYLLAGTHRIFYFKTILATLLLLLIFQFAEQINRINRKEMIVYNSPENTVVHLISGKKNYVVSELMIDDHGFENEIVKNTVSRMHLEKPRYIKADESFSDDCIFVRKGILVFEGQQLLFGSSTQNYPENIRPDMVINPASTENFSKISQSSAKIIWNKRFKPRNNQSSAQIYQVTTQGAFRKKW